VSLRLCRCVSVSMGVGTSHFWALQPNQHYLEFLAQVVHNQSRGKEEGGGGFPNLYDSGGGKETIHKPTGVE